MGSTKTWEPPPGKPFVRPRKRAWLAGTHRCPSEGRYTLNRNQCRAPLLRLPGEIRKRIYEFVFGNQVAHLRTRVCRRNEEGACDFYYHHRRLKSCKYLKFSHVVCCRGLGREHATYNFSKRPEATTKGKLCLYHVRHEKCYERLSEHVDRRRHDRKIRVPGSEFSDLAIRRKYGVALDLRLILVCRQIHEEAALIPYASNTFAFCDGLDLDLFVSKSLLAPQRKAVTRVQLDGWMCGSLYSFAGVRGPTVKMLKALTHISISVTKYKRCGYCAYAYQFGNLPLVKAEVIVGSDDDNEDRMRRRKQAEKIEHILMWTGRLQGS